MTALLTQNLPLLAGAPNGIKKLRELILELAVRGKLLPQDPSDEPARELLKRVTEEKARLEAEGKIKKQKPMTEVSEEETPFDLPQGWEWSRLEQISSDVRYGFTASADHQSLEPLLLRITDIQNDEVNWASVPGCDVSPSEVAGYELRDGDIVIARTGGTIGKSYLVTGLTQLAVFASYLIRIGRLDSTYSKFTKVFLGSQLYWKQLYAHSMGTGQPNVNGTALKGLLISLPPLAEQHRIVAKVDELMALCDRLEVQQADAESAHARLVQALLDSLTQARDAADFATNWQRLVEHFHTLFSTESSIEALKQTLVQLAVMGKLVPQEPSDEPASALLKRITEKKALLVAEGRIRKQKDLGGVTEPLVSFSVPQGWTVTTIGEAIICRDGERIPVSQAEREGREKKYDYYGASGVIDKIDGYLFDKPLLLVGEDGANLINRSTPIAFIARGRYWVNNHAHVLDGISEQLLRYVELYFNAIDLKPYVTGTAQPKMNQAKMNGIPLALPPEGEQHRILAKVDELMILCYQLKTQLIQARRFNEQLAVVLVERALVADTNFTDTAINQEKARTLLAAEIVQQLHCEKRMGRVKLQKVISLAEHIARLKEIQSNEERYAAGPHDPALMTQVVQGLRESQWFEELTLDDGKRYEYRPLALSGAHRPAYEALWSTEQRQQISELIGLMRPWDTARCERVATLYSAWNDLLIEGREACETAILQEVLHGWNESKLKYSETQWRAELAEMQQHSFLIPTGFGNRTIRGKLTLPGFEQSI